MNSPAPQGTHRIRQTPPSAATAWLLLGLIFTLAGCATGPSQQAVLAHTDYPPDFSLVFFVDSAKGQHANVLHRRALYVLSVDRTLRVALGPGVQPDLFPPISARLSPRQMVTVYHLARQAGLLKPSAATNQPRHNHPGTTIYRITTQANNTQLQTLRPAGKSPAVAKLLRKLASLGGVSDMTDHTPPGKFR